ncbi:hypothetical protein IMF27_28640 [Pseudomonas sp. PCH199]|uniref:hypothetical protein n=1 Tax=unclassified Pseudomonas TaxID=196821 RepID=UPI000BC86005|nr:MULTISPECIES: hypothetical protein [unclassified Pseudomonas]MCW8278993.1 hypothetical protein [Pseudomonas sp. PCH199]PAM79703.1 hypothetical protein CES87_29315 [Pseudomonas sp. ERMR1:02]
MPALKNFVAVDWRAGKDKIYFFFKDINKYSRFDLADNLVEAGPTDIKATNWGAFHSHAKDLRFGFTTTAHNSKLDGAATMSELELDILWLFYYMDEIPTVCRYDQDLDKVISVHSVKDSKWRALLPYFDRIVAGTWWKTSRHEHAFRFLLNDGTFLNLDFQPQAVTQKLPPITHLPITDKYYPGLEPYKNRIIAAVQNDQPLFNCYYYIFLTNNEYIRYSIDDSRVDTGPRKIDDGTWPGLLRD